MKWKLDNSIVANNPLSMQKKAMLIGIICALMDGIIFADDWQQRRFAILRHGYYCMEQHQYEEAITSFEQYLNVESFIYWYLIELVNDESCYRKNVNYCLEECRSLQFKLYGEGELKQMSDIL